MKISAINSYHLNFGRLEQNAIDRLRSLGFKKNKIDEYVGSQSQNEHYHISYDGTDRKNCFTVSGEGENQECLAIIEDLEIDAAVRDANQMEEVLKMQSEQEI